MKAPLASAKAGIEMERSTRSAMAWTARPSASLTNVNAHGFCVEVDIDAVAAANLIGSDQVGHGLDQQALDGALQMTCAVLQVGSFLQQEVPGFIGGFEDERFLGRGVEDPLLDHVQLDVQDLSQFVGAERLERDDLIQPVDELRREFAARCFGAAACHFAVQLFVHGSVLGLPRALPRTGSQAWDS